VCAAFAEPGSQPDTPEQPPSLAGHATAETSGLVPIACWLGGQQIRQLELLPAEETSAHSISDICQDTDWVHVTISSLQHCNRSWWWNTSPGLRD